MKSSPTSKWIVDAALLVGYCVAVWFDLTGLELHQWLGVGVMLLAGYHLLTHLDWVKAVTRRFFGKTSSQARLYYLIDALLLGSFVTIGVTGLLISTWLNLTLGSLGMLATIHEWSAYLTLAAVVVKLALHWRWIVNVAGKFFKAPAAPRANPGLPAVAQASGGTASAMPTRGYTRREAFKLVGTALSTAAVVGVAARALGALQAPDSGSTVAAAAPATATTSSATSAPAATTTAAAPAATTTAAAPAATSVAVAAAPTATTTAASVATVSVACLSCRRGKHCSYPGDCRDYVDTNGNNLCDRGECA